MYSNFSLSKSLVDKKATPSEGTPFPAANSDFAYAKPKLSANPITSPVERISGPSKASEPGNLLKGKTASLTA